MIAQNWLLKPRIVLLTSQRTDDEIAVTHLVEHMYILIEILTTSKEVEAKAQNRQENKIMPTGCSKNSGILRCMKNGMLI